jgi:hypothetical protein
MLTVEGGIRRDGTKWFIRVLPWEHGEEEQLQAVTAVLAVMKMPGGVLVIRNARGWDLPGGHVEPGESPMEALKQRIYGRSSSWSNCSNSGCLPGNRSRARSHNLHARLQGAWRAASAHAQL